MGHKVKDMDITLAPGAEEAGLAVMLKDLLSQNLEQRPHKAGDFEKLRCQVGLIVTDADMEILMEFKGGALTIHSGIEGKPDLVITADSDMVMALSNVRIKWGLPYYLDEAGREVLGAMRSGRIKVAGMFLHFPNLIRLSRVMSVR